MENNIEMTPEELQQAVEKAKREMREMLEKMTPEERAQANARAKQVIEEDKAAMQKMIDDAQKVAAEIPSKEAEKPKFCPGCGAPAGDGNFCAFCGGPLKG